MPLVSFHDVEKTYQSLQGVDYPAVEHFALDIDAGEFFCLLGPERLRQDDGAQDARGLRGARRPARS